ncbi:hypothetical protein [Aquimarina spongiae]|uniref:Transglutaminase-like superfamily protein n=1 Tax=Aquimarina spongiae TaxID=570521 RepID=A0A1M6JEW4_9FLAO|nr:hypothetical protein [Aquimarina spongiae]SHJ45217.1 hypothetical protein SAMN04488508_10930 [Aquimarina spongiae]
MQNPLYRPLMDGKRFDVLLPKTNCTSTTLASGDTHVTVNHMADWVKKHYKQTERLAPKLKRRTVKQTVDSIYEFLYNHFQYKADGELQQLRSPGCSWYQRKEGIDCKSYSIFTSCLLMNLGIDHYIREVRQPGTAPQLFTHVYITVPKKGKSNAPGNYYVIDATKHENTEVPFLEAKDTFMSALPHVGLNGPGKTKRRYRRGLRLPETANRGFENFLKFLSIEGVSPSIVNAIRKEAQFYLDLGIHPDFAITDQGVIVQRKLFPFKLNRGLREPLTTGAIASASKLVLESNFFKKTLGAVFANGFDFSCIGSSYTPARAKNDVQVDMPYIVRQSGLESVVNNTTLNKFLNLAQGYRDEANNGTASRFAKCTRDGHRLREQAVTELINRVMNEVKANFILTPSGQKNGVINLPAGNAFPGYRRGLSYRWGGGNGRNYSYQSYTVQRKPNSTGGGITTGGSNTGGGITTGNPIPGDGFNTGGGVITTPLNPTVPVNQPQVQRAGIGVGGIVIATAALGTIFYPQIKKAMSKKSTKTSK